MILTLSCPYCGAPLRVYEWASHLTACREIERRLQTTEWAREAAMREAVGAEKPPPGWINPFRRA